MNRIIKYLTSCCASNYVIFISVFDANEDPRSY